VSDADQILRAADSIVVVDWPSRNVPDTLSRAGYDVSVKGGPGYPQVVTGRPAGEG
jgi:hypothetical protein